MQATVLIHVVAGALALLSGYFALYAAKGGRLHRRIGMVFVYTMLTMGLTGAAVAALTGVHASVIMGTLTAYLVFTGLTTVRALPASVQWLNVGAIGVACALGVALIWAGLQALASPTGMLDGLPAPAAFVFGAVALLASASDVRVMRVGGIRGPARIVRHLWRMCFALFIAAMSFFFGQMDEIPEPLREPALLAPLVLAPLVGMGYWLWRIRFRRVYRGLLVASPLVAVPSSNHTDEI